MTKEELEKEAEGYTNKLLEDWELYDPEALQEAYLAGAEPREKRIADLEKENAELKEKVSFLEDNLRVARKDREDLQLDVAKGLKEFVKDNPATALRYLANEKYVEQLTNAKELLKKIYNFEYGIEADFPKFDLVKWSIETRDFLKDSEVEK